MPLLLSQNIMVDRSDGNRFAYPDISLQAKDTCLLTGPSGSGKTTFLSVIAGLLPPTTGAVQFQGEDIYKMAPRRRDRLRGQKMGFVFQTLHLLPSLTLKQNIALASDLTHAGQPESRIDEILMQLGLDHKANICPDKLSQGEMQRAAIARAVLNKPSIIFADEPTSALDRDNALKVINLLKWQAERTGAALLVATHDDRIMPEFSKIIPIDDVKKAKAA